MTLDIKSARAVIAEYAQYGYRESCDVSEFAGHAETGWPAALDECERLRALLIDVAGFMRGVSGRDDLEPVAMLLLRDEADRIRKELAGE